MKIRFDLVMFIVGVALAAWNFVSGTGLGLLCRGFVIGSAFRGLTISRKARSATEH